jgi:hypothetical protein
MTNGEKSNKLGLCEKTSNSSNSTAPSVNNYDTALVATAQRLSNNFHGNLVLSQKFNNGVRVKQAAEH